MGAFDGVRNLLNIRQKRRRPRAGFRPRVGATIVMDDFRIIVQAGLSDELWNWLTQAGFREIAFVPDRRLYRDLPPSIVSQMYQAPPEQWRPLLMVALQEAAKRPRVRVGKSSVRVSS